MISRSFGFLAASLALSFVSAGLACAQMPSSSSTAAPKGGTAAPAHGETGALMVLNTHSARLAGRTLWLEEASAIVFADRPIRRGLRVDAMDGRKLNDAVVELTSPRLAGIG